MSKLISLVPTARSQSIHHTGTWRVFQIAILLLAAAFLTHCAKRESERGGDSYGSWRIPLEGERGGFPAALTWPMRFRSEFSSVRAQIQWQSPASCPKGQGDFNYEEF